MIRSWWLQSLDPKNRSITTIRTIRSSTWTRSILTWQSGWWSGRPPKGGVASIPPWQLPDFGQSEQSRYDKLPDLRELLNQARQARMPRQIPVQSVAPMPLPFASMRDLVRQHQQCHDQTLAKCQSFLLDGEQCKWAKTPLQPNPHDAPNEGCVWSGGHENLDRGCSRTRSKHRQWELDRARGKRKSLKCSKSHKCSKSCKHSKRRKCSKSRKHREDRACSKHEVQKPGVWSSQWRRSPSKGCRKEDRPHQSPNNNALPFSHSYEQTGNGWPAEHLAPCNNELLKFPKLKEEVVKHPQSYIRGHTTVVFSTLALNHEAVKCLMAFGKKAKKYAAEVLAMIEWGT